MRVTKKNLRVLNGANVVDSYILANKKDYENEPKESVIIDLMVNILHYAHSLGLNTEAINRMAVGHFVTEK